MSVFIKKWTANLSGENAMTRMNFGKGEAPFEFGNFLCANANKNLLCAPVCPMV